MKTSFAGLLLHDSRLFKQEICDNTTDRVMLKIELNIHIFAKTWRIVIAVGFRISKWLENRIRLDKHILNPGRKF